MLTTCGDCWATKQQKLWKNVITCVITQNSHSQKVTKIYTKLSTTQQTHTKTTPQGVITSQKHHTVDAPERISPVFFTYAKNNHLNKILIDCINYICLMNFIGKKFIKVVCINTCDNSFSIHTRTQGIMWNVSCVCVCEGSCLPRSR